MSKLAITVEVRLIGFLREKVDDEKVVLEFDRPVSVRDILSKLDDDFSLDFQQGQKEPGAIEAHPSLLVLLNGKDINVLRGQTTQVLDGDKLVLIPISHGG